jgi:hypothetical protein
MTLMFWSSRIKERCVHCTKQPPGPVSLLYRNTATRICIEEKAVRDQTMSLTAVEH